LTTLVQPFDYTTLVAVLPELQQQLLPGRLEQVYQWDRYTLSLGLRTLQARHWLTICWQAQAARLHLGSAPPRQPDTFTFSQQLQHQLKGLALGHIELLQPWERVVDLRFSARPDEAPLWHLYVELMGKHSNVLLVNSQGTIIAVGHQVSGQQSSIRPIQTGDSYVLPPTVRTATPRLEETFENWRDRVSLLPGAIARNLLQTYRGLSSRTAERICALAGLDPQTSSTGLTEKQWLQLYEHWQGWLQSLQQHQFKPALWRDGYTVLGWDRATTTDSVNQLLAQYYEGQTAQQRFQQLHHQLQQRLRGQIQKLQQKIAQFETRLQQADDAEHYRRQADLLMAHLSHWQPGLTSIELPSFESGELQRVPLNPKKNAVQNAQGLYRQHQKLKRTRTAVDPLLQAARLELAYLEQVDASIVLLQASDGATSLRALEEIQAELQQQGLLALPTHRQRDKGTEAEFSFLRYTTPAGHEVWIGRNNRQNDHLTFRVATDYDLWFHTQEIPGSHALLRLPPGQVPTAADLQFTADLAARYSRGCQSEQVPVVYTQPRHVYKPKGARPGMVIYRQEQVLWGHPQTAGQPCSPKTD
jgi:predicted ribosome quality control (RQC) complex YloA/Tae2 family protein